MTSSIIKTAVSCLEDCPCLRTVHQRMCGFKMLHALLQPALLCSSDDIFTQMLSCQALVHSIADWRYAMAHHISCSRSTSRGLANNIMDLQNLRPSHIQNPAMWQCASGCILRHWLKRKPCSGSSAATIMPISLQGEPWSVCHWHSPVGDLTSSLCLS